MIIVTDERSGKKKHRIQRGRNDDVKPENGVIVLRLGVGKIGERGAETTVLQCRGNQRENADHRHHAIVGRGKQTTENDAECQTYDLLDATVQTAP